MKSIIIIISLILFGGCKEESPTENRLIVQQKYTIAELESDTNWVEITDIDTLTLPCIWTDVYEIGELCKSDSEFTSLYNESKSLMNHSEMPYCNEDTNYINIDYSLRSLILFDVSSNGGKPIFNRRIFKNSSLKEYRYILELTIRSLTEENSGFTEVVSIPKVSGDMTMIFDTLRFYNN